MPFFTVDLYFPSMVFNDLIDNAQSQTCSFLFGFCRKKRLENLFQLFRRNTCSQILKRQQRKELAFSLHILSCDNDLFILMGGLTIFFPQRVTRIIDEINHNLLYA